MGLTHAGYARVPRRSAPRHARFARSHPPPGSSPVYPCQLPPATCGLPPRCRALLRVARHQPPLRPPVRENNCPRLSAAECPSRHRPAPRQARRSAMRSQFTSRASRPHREREWRPRAGSPPCRSGRRRRHDSIARPRRHPRSGHRDRLTPGWFPRSVVVRGLVRPRPLSTRNGRLGVRLRQRCRDRVVRIAGRGRVQLQIGALRHRQLQ